MLGAATSVVTRSAAISRNAAMGAHQDIDRVDPSTIAVRTGKVTAEVTSTWSSRDDEFCGAELSRICAIVVLPVVFRQPEVKCRYAKAIVIRGDPSLRGEA
jgi:hypothetical protein